MASTLSERSGRGTPSASAARSAASTGANGSGRKTQRTPRRATIARRNAAIESGAGSATFSAPVSSRSSARATPSQRSSRCTVWSGWRPPPKSGMTCVRRATSRIIWKMPCPSRASTRPGRTTRCDLVVRPGLVLAREGHGIFQMMRDVARRTHVIPLFGGGRQPLQTVHLDDLCEGVARALERELTGALNVAEPAPLSMAAFLRAMVARLGVRCVFLPLPFAPVLAALRAAEALGVPLPLRSESVLAIRGLRQAPVAEDLRRLDLSVRSAEESLADVL